MPFGESQFLDHRAAPTGWVISSIIHRSSQSNFLGLTLNLIQITRNVLREIVNAPGELTLTGSVETCYRFQSHCLQTIYHVA